MTPGTASLAKSVVFSAASTVAAGSKTTFTLTANDANGNQETTGGLTVDFVLGSGTAGGTFSAVTDNHDGTYTATFTAVTTGSSTIVARIGGQPVTSAAPGITVTPGVVSPSQSSVALAAINLPAGITTTVTLTTRDANGNLETGGLAVAFALGTGSAGGSFSSVTDNHDGTYSAGFSASTAGTNTITAIIGGQTVSSTPPTVTIMPGAVNLLQSTISATAASIQSGSTTTVKVTAKDAFGNVQAKGGLSVGLTLGSGAASGTFSAVTDNGDGTYTAIFTAAKAGVNTIQATIGGLAVASSLPTVTITPGPVSLSQSTATFPPANLPSGSSATATLTARDANGNQQSGGGLPVGFVLGAGTAAGTFGTVIDNHDGTYSATFTATTAGTNTIAVFIGLQAITTAAPVITVTPGPVSLARSVVQFTPGTILPAGTGTATLTVKDASGNQQAGGGLTVAFQLGNGAAGGRFGAVTDNNDGIYTASFQASAIGTNTVTATIGGQAVTSTPATVTIASAGVGPVGTITSQTPTFFWAGTGAPSYTLWIADKTTGKVPVLSVPNIQTTSWTLTTAQALTPGHSYTWYVGGVVGSRVTWGAGQDFAIAPWDAPTNLAASATIPDQPTFSWSGVPGVATYKVWLHDDLSGLATAILTTATTLSLNTSQALTRGHAYTWYVAAVSANGQGVFWSQPQTFSVAELAHPSGLSATIGSKLDQPTFAWSAVAGAASYQVYVYDQVTQVKVTFATKSTSLTLSAAQALTRGHTYMWYVGAVGTNGQGVSLSTTQKLAIAPLPIPTGLRASGPAYQPTFSWSAVPDAGSYQILIRDMNTGYTMTYTGLTGTSFRLDAAHTLKPFHHYLWYVGAIGTNGKASAWTPGMSIIG